MIQTPEQAIETWIDEQDYAPRWKILKKIPGGGQGNCFKAQRVSDQRIAFLKVIKEQSNAERRIRFFREASAYETFMGRGVPVLIESNAHHHKNRDYISYLATEFVEGPTLRQWRERSSALTLDQAIAGAQSLLQILSDCHAAEHVHRDIKPDNIKVCGVNPLQLVLLDFGLDYHEKSGLDFDTEHGQEIGNRFLRLPELSAGSRLKRDPRSDISFAAGILLYLLLGIHPDILQDGEGRLPHQRGDTPAKLEKICGHRFRALMALFDSAFAPQIHYRIVDVRTVQQSLNGILDLKAPNGSSEDDLRAILEVMDTVTEARKIESINRFDAALRKVDRLFRSVASADLKGTLAIAQTAWNVTAESGSNTLYWSRPGTVDRLLTTSYEVKEAGDELIISVAGELVYRTSLVNPRFDGPFDAAMRNWVLARIRSAVTTTNALPQEAEYFAEIKPIETLGLAADEARRLHRNIMAFVYDPSQKDRGQLEYLLSSFLRNKRTRDKIADTFVVALVPLSDVQGRTAVLNGQSMESSRWILFSSDLAPLEQQVIYANAEEAERIVFDLASRQR